VPVDRPEVNSSFIAIEERLDRFGHVERYPEHSGDEVPGPARKNADWYVAMRERPYDLHHSSVASERENRVVGPTSLLRDLGSVTGSLGQHPVALHSALGKRRLGLRQTTLATTGPGIDDEKDALS
jgi:hypothetical protein